jgi:DNA-binding XRE family transcriptional regulator
MIKNNLWQYRKRWGYTQKQVAFLLGHKSTWPISDYERGRRLPKWITAMKLGIILHVPSDFLYQDLYGNLKRQIRDLEESPQFKKLRNL